MNQETNTAVMDAPTEQVESMEQLDALMQDAEEPTVMVVEVEQGADVPEIMELPENVNPNVVDEISTVDPESDDIMEEMVQMDTFQEYQRDIAREMRGYNSDQF